MVTGFAVRLAQGLQINVEHSNDNFRTVNEFPSLSSLESRRRLMWSIYAMDSWVGSGVDELTLVREANIKIRLPCDERDFILESVSLQADLELLSSGLSGSPGPNLDVAGHFLRLVSIRRRVLRYVSTLLTGYHV
jgi:hypothetical protein